MSIFNYKDYKNYLINLLKHKDAPRGIQSSMARAIGCQSAFIYQVLKGKGDFTEDQSYQITLFLKLNEIEREYFLLLVRYSKSSNGEYKKFLVKELQKLSQESTNLKNKVSATLLLNDENEFLDWYTTNPLPTLIHILSSSSHYQTTKKLSDKLNVSESTLLKILNELEKNNFVKKQEGKWIHNKSSIHFEKSSKNNYQIQLNRRIRAMSTLNQNTKSDDIFFSTLFTLDNESLAELKNIIAEFVQSSHKIIHTGGTTEAYILNLDLFAI